MLEKSVYKADLAGVSLKIQESRIISRWLLDHQYDNNSESWDQLIYADNALQIRGRSTIRRQANLLRARLQTMPNSVLNIICDGNYNETAQACLAAAIKHSRLLGDFLDITLREEVKKLNKEITPWHWRVYLETCRNTDPLMTEWSKSTQDRMKTTVFTILQEAGLFYKEKGFFLKTIMIDPKLEEALSNNDEEYVLRCMRFYL